MFLKIGDLYINQDHIVNILKGDDCVIILTDLVVEDAAQHHTFWDDERQALLNWLANKAEVSVVC